jgi:hypothetical protein
VSQTEIAFRQVEQETVDQETIEEEAADADGPERIHEWDHEELRPATLSGQVPLALFR